MQEKKTCECRIPDSPHMRAVSLLIRNMRRHHALVERKTCDLGIHHSQHRMLMTLARRQEHTPSQKELAERLGISAAAVTATLKKLEKEEYITRSMTDEELCDAIFRILYAFDPGNWFCKGRADCAALMEADKEIPDEWCKACLLAKLREPAEQTPPATMAAEEKQESGLLEED